MGASIVAMVLKAIWPTIMLHPTRCSSTATLTSSGTPDDTVEPGFDAQVKPRTLSALSRTSWVASAFGACTVFNGELTVKARTVQCVDVFDGSISSSGLCQLSKPCDNIRCTCGTEVCDQSNEAPPTATSRCMDNGAGAVLEGDGNYTSIGCIAGVDAHSSSDSFKYDVTCMNATSSMCRGGLPFYRYSKEGMTVDSCFDFCSKRGLDLFGMLSSLECRCGASRINKGVWGDAKPRKPLQFVPDDLTACTGAQEFKVHRYIGHFEASCLPSASVHVGVSDAVYIKSIVAGKRIHQEPVNKALPPPAASQGSSSGSLRSCLSGCGPAFNWDNRLSDPPSGLDEKENKWKEYVKIAYKFNYDIDDDRKEAFRWAAKDWLNKTCLLFREETNPSEPYVTVVKEDLEYCWAILGKPRSTPSKVNMGWCNSLNQRGSIVHELGHVAGMLHEQSRPDASGTVAGHGPYLKIHWQNIASDWRSQWAPSMGSYVGSADDGHGDPHVGYSEYDYDSLMHYPCEDMDGKKCEKMYPSKGGSIGQRVGLSQGDVQQILDMYQCKPREGGGGQKALISFAGGFGTASAAMLIALVSY